MAVVFTSMFCNCISCIASLSYSHTGCDSPRSLVHPAFPVFLIPSAIVHRSISSEDCQVNNASFMFSIFVHVPILRRSSFTFPFFIDLRSRSRSSFALSGTRSLDSSCPTVWLAGARPREGGIVRSLRVQVFRVFPGFTLRSISSVCLVSI